MTGPDGRGKQSQTSPNVTLIERSATNRLGARHLGHGYRAATVRPVDPAPIYHGAATARVLVGLALHPGPATATDNRQAGPTSQQPTLSPRCDQPAAETEQAAVADELARLSVVPGLGASLPWYQIGRPFATRPTSPGAITSTSSPPTTAAEPSAVTQRPRVGAGGRRVGFGDFLVPEDRDLSSIRLQQGLAAATCGDGSDARFVPVALRSPGAPFAQ
jgi:hypothetical protein